MHEVVDLEYVGFWPRAWAMIIDSFILFVVTAPLLIMVYGKNYYSLDGYLQGPADLLISHVLPAVIVIAFWNAQNATPGKVAIGAKIVDSQTGEAPTLGQYVGRYFGYFISIFPFLLGMFWVGLDPKKQGWHDKLSGTVVVRLKNRGPEPVSFK